MKITCALGKEQIIALASVVYKDIQTAINNNTPYDLRPLMTRIYNNLAEKQSQENAIVYLMQVPSIAGQIIFREGAKPVTEFDISKILELSEKFRNLDTGFTEVKNYFGTVASPSSIATKSINELNNPQTFGTEGGVSVPADQRKKVRVRNAISLTLEEFYEMDPNTKTDDTVEIADPAKKTIYNVLDRLKSRSSAVIESFEFVELDGVKLRLRPFAINKFPQSLLYPSTAKLLQRMNSIKKQTGEVKPPNEHFVVALVNEKGQIVKFNEQGMVDMENGRPVYQMLRDVRLKNGKYEATDIYGREEQILGAESELLSSIKEQNYTLEQYLKENNTTLEEEVEKVENARQSILKTYFDFRERLIKEGTEGVSMSIVDVSPGVRSRLALNKKYNLNNLNTAFSPETARNLFQNLKILDSAYKGIKAGYGLITINDQIFQVDRPDISEDLARKVAQVLTNDKISDKDKQDFVEQFLSNKIVSSARRQTIQVNGKTNKLEFLYTIYTEQEFKALRDKNANAKNTLLEIDLKGGKTSEDKIFDVLMKGKATLEKNPKGEVIFNKDGNPSVQSYYPAKMAYMSSAVKPKLGQEGEVVQTDSVYFDYENGKFVPKEYFTDLLPTLNAEIFIGKNTPLYNSYIIFSIPNDFNQTLLKIEEGGSKDTRSDIRKFKDSLVEGLKENKKEDDDVETYWEGDIVSRKQSKKDVDNDTYTYEIKVVGFPGVHKVFNSSLRDYVKYKLPQARKDIDLITDEVVSSVNFDVRLVVEDIVTDGILFNDVIGVYIYRDNQRVARIGSLQETAYGETPRIYNPIKTEEANDIEETNDIEDSENIEEKPAGKTPSEQDQDFLNPKGSQQPGDSSRISEEGGFGELDRRKYLGQEGVTQKQIDDGVVWWNRKENRLNQFMSVTTAMDLVNSNVFAKFIVSGHTLLTMSEDFKLPKGKLGVIAINPMTGGNYVDVYHEAWHAFSQLFLTKEQKIKLYDEVRNSNPEYKNMKSIEIEEILAENFREYARNPKPVKQQPVRNTLFRKILNFLLSIFGKLNKSNLLDTDILNLNGVQKYFNELYIGEINNYTPLIENVMFDQLNRGVTDVTDKRTELLNDADSTDLVNTISSMLSKVVDEQAEDSGKKTGTVQILNNTKLKETAFEYVRKYMENQLKTWTDSLDIKQDVSFNQLKTKEEIAGKAIAIIEAKNPKDNKYIFLKDQVESFKNLTASTKEGERVKGRLYKDNIEIIADFYTHDTLDIDILVVDSLEDAIGQYESYIEGKTKKFKGIITQVENGVDSNLTIEQQRTLDNIRVYETALKHWDSVIKYYKSNSPFDIIREKYIPLDEDPDALVILQPEDAAKARTADKKVGEFSLLQLANKETIYILKSLFKVDKTKGRVDGKLQYELDRFGNPVLAEFRTVWNSIVRATNSEKDPVVMYRKIVQASRNFPELEQLINLKLPNPERFSETLSTSEMDITTSFWQDFKRPNVPYIQILSFNDDTTDGFDVAVTNASYDVIKTLRTFQAKFRSDTRDQFIKKVNNQSILDLERVVNEFKTEDGNFDDEKAFKFLTSIGFYLDDLVVIKKEINSIDNRRIYFVHRIYDTVKQIYEASQGKVLSKEAIKFMQDFKTDPIQKLRDGIPAGLLGSEKSSLFKNGISQRTVVDRILTLQNKYGSDASNFSIRNAEGQRVNTHTDDNTATVIADGINATRSMTDMWNVVPDSTRSLKFLKSFNPTINPFTKRLQTFKTLYTPNMVRKMDKYIEIFMNSGTQITVNGEFLTGTSTANLDEQGYFLQGFNGLLLAGTTEFLRPGSKSSAFGWAIKGGIYKETFKDNNPHLYADIDDFMLTNNKESAVIERILIPYLGGEVERINEIKQNPKLLNYIGYNNKLSNNQPRAGLSFGAFDGILKEETQKEILSKVSDNATSLEDYLIEDSELKEKVINEIKYYFSVRTQDIAEKMMKGSFIANDLLNIPALSKLSNNDKIKVLSKAYMYNAWIHNFETQILFLGDITQYGHPKEELHKRISGLISNGPGFRVDIAAQLFIESQNWTQWSYAASLPEQYQNFKYNGTLNTAVIQDIGRDSVYLPIIEEALRKDYQSRLIELPKAEANKIVEERVAKEIAKYKKDAIKEGDGQGYITFDAYRNLKKLQKKWSDPQENLYRRINKGEDVPFSEVIETFPPAKLQHFGFLDGTELPVTGFHKFALVPLVPTWATGDLEILHKEMLRNNIHYLTFESGSKVGTVTSNGVVDSVYEEGSDQKKIKEKIDFTKNTIHVEFLKEVTSVPSKFKGEVIFSTQLRKLILEGLFIKGSIVNEKNKPLVDQYKSVVDSYTEILKEELLQEIGYKKENGVYVGNPRKLLEVMKRNLASKDMPQNLLDALRTNRDGSLRYDLSNFIDPQTLERTLLSIVENRFVRQKLNGEALVQVASSMTNGAWTAGTKFRDGSKEDILKYMGTNNLPFYNTETVDLAEQFKGLSNEDLKAELRSKKNVHFPTPTKGFILKNEIDYLEDVVAGRKPKQTTYQKPTSAMKVAIALQGDFINLLNLNHLDGDKIGTRKRLNEMIKEDEWLNIGNNRKAITMTAVRIPVQGLNSMEFMEVWEFLDPSASNIIIPPTELVAKSGGDYDVDKLTTFMPNIDKEGNYVTSDQSPAEIIKALATSKPEGRMKLIREAKAILENQMIDSIKSILELPENFASLVRPNDTYMLKDLADELQESVSDYDKYSTVNRETPLMLKDKKVVSPTTTLEPLYNVSKFTQNMVGKAVLGIAANENAFSPLFNSIGAKMPLTYKDAYYDQTTNKWMDIEGGKNFKTRLLLLHNKFKTGEISLSDINSFDSINKIADVFSQGMNGWVDVEKDEWIFYIQGNLEISPVMLYLLKAGVPVRDAIMFVSNPLIREYAEKQRMYKGTYAQLMGVAPDKPQYAQYQASKTVIEPAIRAYINREVNKIKISPETDDSVIIKYWEPTQRGGFKSTTYTIDIEEGSNTEGEIKDFIFNEDYYFDPTSVINIQIKKKNANIESVYQRPEVTNAGIYNSAVRLSEQVLGNKETFNSKELEKLAKSKSENDKYSDASLATFLHFLEIEKYLKGLGAVKRTSKVDNILFKTVQEIFLRDLNLKYLDEYSKVDSETLKKLNEESIIASLGDKNIIREIIAPLFSIRNDDKVMEMIKFALSESADKIINRYGSITKETTSRFIEEYKNAINNFIFQNFLSNNLDANGKIVLVPETYKSGYSVKIKNNMDTDVEVDSENKLIFVNTERIESDFKDKQFEVGKEGPRSYVKRGLEPFVINDTFSNIQSYYKYVIEREYLRAEGVASEDLNKIALINVFNPNVIMRSIKHSYTQQVLDVIKKYEKELSKYSVLQQLAPSTGSPLLNLLTLNDKQLVDGNLANIYSQQIRDLGNERIRKVSIPGDKEKEKAANKEISRIFYLLPLMAVYQHGVGPTISGFNEILPQDHYLSVMNNASNLFKEYYFNRDTLTAILDKLTDSTERHTYNNKVYATSLPTSKDTFIYNAPLYVEEAQKNTDEFQYFGAPYTIILEDGVGIDVVGYQGKPSAKAKLLAAYNTNPNVDPQNGKPFRGVNPDFVAEPPVLPTSPTGTDNDQNSSYSFTFSNGIEIQTPFKLNPEQQAALLALENFYRNPAPFNNVVTLIGYAGTGKTSIMSIFDKWLQATEFIPKIVYSAPTHRANAVTKLKNPQAKVLTLHKLFGLGPQVVFDPTSADYNAKYDTITVGKGTVKISNGDTLIIDEASMVTDGLYQFLMQGKERYGLKIIFMGDPGQLGPVQDSGVESKVFANKSNLIRLTQVMRTGDNPILKESTALRSGGDLSYVSSETNGKGVEYTSDQARMAQIISSGIKTMMDTQDYLNFRILSATNNAAAEANRSARRVLFGERAKEQLLLGDVIMGYANFGTNYKTGQPKIMNAGDYKVTALDKDQTKDIYIPSDIEEIPQVLKGKNLSFTGYKITLQNILDKSEDPVRDLFVPYIKDNDTNLRVLGELVAIINTSANRANADKATRFKAAELYSLADKLKSSLLTMEDVAGRTDQIKIPKYIDYGYAHTIHKSQGGTYTSVMILDDTIDPLTRNIQRKRKSKGNQMSDQEVKTMQRQLRYVAVSRATDYVYISTDSGLAKMSSDEETFVEPGDTGVTVGSMSLSDIGETPTNTPPSARVGNSTITFQGKQVALGDQADFVGNTGAAVGADAYFNYASSGYPVSNMNWHNQGMVNRKKAGLEKDLVLALMENNPQALITDESEYAKAVEIGAKRLGKVAKRQETINKLGRNWFQVKNSDAIFAIADNFYTRPDTNAVDMSNVAGGTGWAVAYAAEKIDGIERPIYVYVQSKNRWYKYNYNKGVFEEYNQTPVLTKRFAGIGTRELKDNGKLAIDNLFKNTFNATTQAPAISLQSSVSSSPINKGSEIEPGLEMFKKVLTVDEQKVFFEFGKRILEKNAYNPFKQYAMASAGKLEWSPEMIIDKNGNESIRQGEYDRSIISIQRQKTGSDGPSSRFTYHYYLSNVDGSPIEPIPSNIISILERITGQSMADYDTVLINLYPIGRTLGWHQDITEDNRNADRDIISVSIGASSNFSYANPGNKILVGNPKESDVNKLQIDSGDVMLFGGKSRLIKHTVTNVAGSTDLGQINLQNSNVNDAFVGGKTLDNWRMNFTFRVANPNNNKGKRGVTRVPGSAPKRFEGKMTFYYGQNARPGLIASTTFDAIKTGERTATTRYESDGNLDYWKEPKVGDIITWEAADGRTVDVVVTKELYPLKGSGLTPKSWSELEGWSSMYFIDKVLPKVDEAYQLQYKLIDTEQYGDITNNDIFDDSDESDLENNCPVPF